MSLQTEFDAIVGHMRKQRAPAFSVGRSCAYRGANGTSCAIGCRIPEELIPDMIGDNGTNVETMFLRHPKVFEALTKAAELDPNSLRTHRFYEGMQAAHDHAQASDFMTDFEGEAAKVAARYCLTYTSEAACPTADIRKYNRARNEDSIDQ